MDRGVRIDRGRGRSPFRGRGGSDRAFSFCAIDAPRSIACLFDHVASIASGQRLRCFCAWVDCRGEQAPSSGRTARHWLSFEAFPDQWCL